MKNSPRKLLHLIFQIAVCLCTIKISNERATATEAADPKHEIRISGGLAKDVRVFQVLEFKELEKVDWKPGDGEVPLSPSKAISLAREFSEKNLKVKLHPELKELSLTSLNIEGVRRWFWQVIYPAYDSSEQIKGTGNPVTIAVSLSGKVMAETEGIAK